MHNQGHLNQTTSLPKFQWSQLFDNSDIENIHNLFTKIVTFSWNISQHHKKSKMPTTQPVRPLVQAGLAHLCPAVGNVEGADPPLTDEVQQDLHLEVCQALQHTLHEEGAGGPESVLHIPLVSPASDLYPQHGLAVKPRWANDGPVPRRCHVGG